MTTVRHAGQSTKGVFALECGDDDCWGPLFRS